MRIPLLALLLAAPLPAQTLDIGVLGAADAASLFDVESSLLGDARIGSVTTYDVSTTTPSLATLQAHDGLLVFATYPNDFADRVALGDNVAAFATAGGGVVECLRSATFLSHLEGAWETNYVLLSPFTSFTFLSLWTLGTVVNPSHPIMAGVSTVSSGPSGWHGNTMGSNAVTIAEWNDGRAMVAEHATAPNVVFLNALPLTPAVSPEGLDPLTDAFLMLNNAVVYTCPALPSGPTLTISGNCGSAGAATLSNFTPGGLAYLGWAFSTGSSVVPGGPCAGSPYGLGGGVTLLATLVADGSGAAVLQSNIPAAACGLVHVQAFDVGSCTASNVVSL